LMAVALAFMRCKSNTDTRQDKPATGTAGTTHTDTVTQRSHAALNITLMNRDSLIVATVSAGSIPDSIPSEVTRAYQRIEVIIDQVNTDSVVAFVNAPGTERNMRINQIIMPDGSMDGPFGHDIHYGTAQKGNYKLIIGKDN